MSAEAYPRDLVGYGSDVPHARWPNGARIAVQFVINYEEGGENSVFVRPFPSGEGRWQISAGLAFEPRWSLDQKELFFRSGSALYRVSIDTRGRFSAGKPEMIIDRVSTAGIVHTYSQAPDGRIFTPRSPEGRGSARTVYLDLGFADRLAAKGGE